MTGHPHHSLTVGSKLKYGIILTSFILVIELAGGVLSNSLAYLEEDLKVLLETTAAAISYRAYGTADGVSGMRC